MFNMRVLVVPSFLLVALGAVACGSSDEAPETKAEGAVVAAPPAEAAYPPATMPALPPPSLPPLPQDPPTITSGPEVDGGTATPAPSTPTPNPNPTPPTPPTPSCAGGEAEVEPNTAASPNVLNGGRCGVLGPGDTEDVLLLNSQSFKLKWSGFVNVDLEASAGGYLVKITSQTPGVATPWTLTVE